MSITEQPSEAMIPLDRDNARLALWKAIEAIKIGNKWDDKLIIDNLAKSSIYLAMKAAEQPRTDAGEVESVRKRLDLFTTCGCGDDDWPQLRHDVQRAFDKALATPLVDQGVVERVTAKQIDQIVTETMNETFANASGGGRFSMNEVIRSAVCKALAAISPQLGDEETNDG